MAVTVFHDQRNSAVARGLRAPRGQVPRLAWALACIGAVLLAGYQLFVLLEAPGDAIRGELQGAAAEMRGQVVLAANPAVLAAMRRHFSEQDVTIAKSPAASIVAVTLHGLDREACVEAAAKARRIDGPVVVMLRGYGAPEDCGSRNKMTWWIMP
jgi:hypothetical protein